MTSTLEAIKEAWIANDALAGLVPSPQVKLHPPAIGTPVPCIGFHELQQSTGMHTSSTQHVQLTIGALAEAEDADTLEAIADAIREHLDEWQSDRWQALHMTACNATISRPTDQPSQQWQMDIALTYEVYRR